MNQTELFNLSKKYVPGGVHSPVRSFKGLYTTPRFFKSGNGAYITDTDGKTYADFCMSFGPLILGHAHPKVKHALSDALNLGWSFGACEPYSLELVEYLIGRLPFIEQMRLVNSGTEAVMTAIRLARGVTKRNKILKFNGCYHGHVDAMLIKAGSGLAGESTSSSAGVPEGVSKDTLIVELNNEDEVRAAFIDHKNEIAAVIIEPLPANNGLLVQRPDFLKFLREITTKEKTLLIFDEVISGFRVGFGGMAEKLKIYPDIVTYGKIIGGGLPVGAIGGSKYIMEHLAPLGPVYQAGTLSANPLAMVGGLTTLKEMTKERYQTIERYTKNIVAVFKDWLLHFQNGKFKIFTVVDYSSLFWIVPKSEVHALSDIPSNLTETFNELFKELLERGIYLAPNAYEVSFVSLAHDENFLIDLKKRLA